MVLTEGTTSRAAAVQQDATTLHLLPLIHTHKQTNTSTKEAPDIHKHTHSSNSWISAPTCFLGLATAFSTNRAQEK